VKQDAASPAAHSVTGEQARLDTYKELLLTWNRKVNLIGPEAVANLDEHIAEALEAAGILQPEGEVLDFGSGGGLPAIPMAIRSPGARFHLVEADQKKWAFLKFAARECALNSIIHGDRLERLISRLEPGIGFSLVTSRAVGYPGKWVGLLAPFLTPGGRVALFQGSAAMEPIEGFAVQKTVRLTRGTSNYLVILEKQK
jgi:16S rRNA (guanine527-N7)-methyltransferase